MTDRHANVRAEAEARIGHLSRRQLEEVLLRVGILPYDDESIQELREAVRVNLADGTLRPSNIPK